MDEHLDSDVPASMPATRNYQQEMLDESLHNNIIIALDTGSGKTHIAVLRMKMEAEREPTRISWFVAPTVALCEQQRSVIQTAIPVSVGLISGAQEPDQWKNAALWKNVLSIHRIMVTTPQILLDALRHSYISLGRDIGLLIFDEAHHAVDNHPYNRIMQEFYFECPPRTPGTPVSNYIRPVRPMILGLTASPIFGGNVIKAFQTIENNLDSIIRSPRRHRDELARFVHRPVFKHVMYNPYDDITNTPFSTNLAALCNIVDTLDIENDPYVITMRRQLSRATPRTAEYTRIDQKLSNVINKQSSFTHKGLRDFVRSATDILWDLGPWAADWYVWQVLDQARRAANPYNNIVSNWKNDEKAYLFRILDQVILTPVSYYPDDIVDDVSDKVRALVECLIAEKHDTEVVNESYSGLIFVQRRDAVLALSEVLSHHPLTSEHFRVGCLLGTSDNAHRHSFLDITRKLLKQSQEDTLMDFRIGDKNVIVSTSVAEEGLDIQACGSVIRWDPPPNMASWAQSRGRARRQRSTFTLMFEEGGSQRASVMKWEALEQEMISLYNDPLRDLDMTPPEEEDLEDNDMEFRVPSTGALLTLHSAVSHLSHFCAVIPNTAHIDHRPLYDIDPPEYQEGWHSFDNRSTSMVEPYTGPYGAKVTLPRLLPLELREFSVEKIYLTKISAFRHAAFNAYIALYRAELLNENLLPITSVVEPHLEQEVKDLLQEVEKRSGMANVSIQINPWEGDTNYWWSSELTIDGLPPLHLFTRSEPLSWDADEGPVLYRTNRDPVRTRFRSLGILILSEETLRLAREYTRRLFGSLNGSRMKWDDLDFCYLFLPFEDVDDSVWEARRSWLASINAESGKTQGEYAFSANAQTFGQEFSYPSDLVVIKKGNYEGKSLRFVRWRFEPLSSEEEEELFATYSHFSDIEITYPLLVATAFPPRTNFLLPIPPKVEQDAPPAAVKYIHLLPRASAVTLLSPHDIDYAFLLPSVLRSLAMSLTINSLRNALFSESPLYNIPPSLLTTAMTAPVSQERSNYQRLETLGDTVLKFVVGIQLLSEYPLWHEGYLSRKKDHAVSNVRLAKEDIAKGLYRWIIRDRMLGKKWKPEYFTTTATPTTPSVQPQTAKQDIEGKKPKRKSQELSTKVLADVIESLIGAAYLHGGFDLGYECAKFFDLGLKWQPLQPRIETMLSRVETEYNTLPPQLAQVEEMIGYKFNHKLLLIEALTHASYQQDLHTVSYERMEFLGDSVLDMIVTDYLYHAPGKEYSPGHLFLRKSAMVNAHILAYTCLRCFLPINAAMPRPGASSGSIEMGEESHRVYLWQCLLHSSHRVLEDQKSTYARYCRRKGEIEDALEKGTIFPWAALTRLQAPKFLSDMVESVLGAVYLDSHGDIATAKRVMRKLGLMRVLERIVQDDMDVLHPVSRLSLWGGKHGKEIEYTFEKAKGNVSCVILVDGKEEVRVADVWRGHASQEEVKFAAAEEAIKMFKLRDVHVNYTLMKAKKHAPKKKVRVV